MTGSIFLHSSMFLSSLLSRVPALPGLERCIRACACVRVGTAIFVEVPDTTRARTDTAGYSRELLSRAKAIPLRYGPDLIPLILILVLIPIPILILVLVLILILILRPDYYAFLGVDDQTMPGLPDLHAAFVRRVCEAARGGDLISYHIILHDVILYCCVY